MKKLTDLKLYKDTKGELLGYDSQELRGFLEERGLIERWREWFAGSTGAIIDGHFIVYKWDVESFLAGEPNLD